MYCSQCGKEQAEGHQFCPQCGTAFVGGNEGCRPSPDSLRTRTPWDSRDTIGTLSALWFTLLAILLRPAEFFRTMEVRGGISGPLMYALLIGMFGLMTSSVWDAVLHHHPRHFTANLSLATEHGGHYVASSPLGAAAIPFLFIIWLFVLSGFFHLVLLLARGAWGGFEATFRAVAFGISPMVCFAVPVAGGMIGSIWTVMTLIVALREAHGTTSCRAAFAVLFPIFFLFGILFFLLALFMGLTAVSLGGLMRL